MLIFYRSSCLLVICVICKAKMQGNLNLQNFKEHVPLPQTPLDSDNFGTCDGTKQ